MGKTELGLLCLNNKRYGEASRHASFIRRLKVFFNNNKKTLIPILLEKKSIVACVSPLPGRERRPRTSRINCCSGEAACRQPQGVLDCTEGRRWPSPRAPATNLGNARAEPTEGLHPLNSDSYPSVSFPFFQE